GQMAAIVAAARGPRVLEVGCGNGSLSRQLEARGMRVVAADVAPGLLAELRPILPAGIGLLAARLPRLPFPDRAFDTVVCAHTLEHLPALHEAARELERVAAGQLLVVVPRQRYYRYTIDYHVHFFPSSAPLRALFPGLPAEVRRVDGDWLLEANRP